MKAIFRIAIFGGLLHCWLPACSQEPDRPDGRAFCPQGDDPAAWVDPMIGTLGPGNSVPGALVPHGMVKLSPDTNAEPGSVDAYEYANDEIEGFSHTHLQGPGGGNNGYSHILLIPTTGPLQTATLEYSSAFSHESEEATPGYYAVDLDDYGVRAELTATAHAGLHRYTFPAADQARVLIDLGHSRGESKDGEVEILDERTIQGHGEYNVHPLLELMLAEEAPGTGMSKVYFHAVFDPADYVENGWVSHECDGTQSASMTLEYAYDDWCIARMARQLDKPDMQAVFERRAGNWRNHYNPQTGFMQGRNRDGSWVEPFDPASMDDFNDFCEASAWIYSWFVPHDVPGLIELMGGSATFADKLDRFFEDGHFDSSNEPSFHVPLRPAARDPSDHPRTDSSRRHPAPDHGTRTLKGWS